MLTRILAESLEQPLVQGKAETLFGPVNDGIGDDAAYRLLEQRLQNSVPNLILNVINNWRAAFGASK